MNINDFKIAIVSMAFRFPGDLDDETAFWNALKAGRDVVTSVPPERWNTDLLQHPRRSEPGRSVTFSAGVISRVDEFDAGFFGISPREAAWLDPQQRLLLELSWEAMENGGIRPSSLAGTDCAVYVGISGIEYGVRTTGDVAGMTAHSMTGNVLSIAANRISYAFDLHGPSIAIDTACSSSLVALHQACRSLQVGESSTALVGGVNILAHPYPFIGFSKASMLSSSGRCRAFDAAGDGYVRAEGGMVLVLKPLAKALADGDPIQAVILGTGTNTDGGRKTGLTIPSQAAQAELMSRVLRQTGLSAGDIDYVEAHGTGTAVGDPIEAGAIGQVYGQRGTENGPLPIGSIKTNLGHMEPASGMAGLAKAIMILKHHAIPPSLHFTNPNPRINFKRLNLAVNTQHKQLEPTGKKLVVGINSFGFGGVNAHLLIQEYPREFAKTGITENRAPIFLSARTQTALRESAKAYAELLNAQPDSWYDIAAASFRQRDLLEKRAAVFGSRAEEIAEELKKLSLGQTSRQMVVETQLSDPGSVAFVYTGNGVQWLGMGQKLLRESSRFASLMHDIDSKISARTGVSIIEELLASEEASHMHDTAVAQQLLFAIQVAITTLLRENGVKPSAAVGHSVGEVASAWASGALSLEQAVDVICVRSALQALTAGSGSMAATGFTADAARQAITEHQLEGLEVSVINGPKNVVVSGGLEELGKLGKIAKANGVFFRKLGLDYAFHSRAMDPIRDNLLANLADLTPSRTSEGMAFVSTVTGNVVSGTTLNAQYWWSNVRQPVQFAQAIFSMLDLGCRIFVEVGPNAILQHYIRDCIAERKADARVLSTLRKGDDGISRLKAVTLNIHLLTDLAEAGIYFPASGATVRLPNYPWQHEHYWHPRTQEAKDLIEQGRSHPLLGWRVHNEDNVWENILDPVALPWLADHKVGDSVVYPGSAYIEMALAAGREQFGGTAQEIENLDILAPIVFDGEHARSLRFDLSARDGSFTIRSRQRLSDEEWMLNASGRLLGHPATNAASGPARAEDPPRFAYSIARSEHLELTAALGLHYGPAFRWLKHTEASTETLAGTLAAPEVADVTAGYLLPPGLTDGCFQSLVAFFHQSIRAGEGHPFLPVKVSRIRLFSSATVVRFRARLLRSSIRSVLADFELLSADGSVVALLQGCRFRAAHLRQAEKNAPACWIMEAFVKNRPAATAPANLPDTTAVCQQLHQHFLDEESALQRNPLHQTIQPLLEALTLAFIYEAFQSLAIEHDDWFQTSLSQPETVAAENRPLFSWLTRILQDEDLLVREESGRWVLNEADLPPAQAVWQSLAESDSIALPELVLTGHIGLHLADALRTPSALADLSKQIASSHQTEAMLADSPIYAGSQYAVIKSIGLIATAWPQDRRLRILEIAGTHSGTPRYIADTLDTSRIDYVFASSNPDARLKMQGDWQAQPFVSVMPLDEALPPASAQEPAADFDIVIFSHVLQKSDNVAEVLASARHRLARDAYLILAETYPSLNLELISSIQAGTWRPAQHGRPAPSHASSRRWEKLLPELGFDELTVFREPASEDREAASYLVLARSAQAAAGSAITPPGQSWWILADTSAGTGSLARNLAERLQSQGHQATIDCLDSSEEPLPEQLQKAREAMASLDHVMLLASTDLQDAPGKATALVTKALSLVQALHAAEIKTRLCLVARSIDDTPERTSPELPADPALGALWGFGRVVMNEHPALACSLIHLSADLPEEAAAAALSDELLHPDGETEIVLADSGRHAIRMQAIQPDTAQWQQNATSTHFRLDFRTPGQLRNLVWLAQAPKPVADDEVEVRVMSSGLNFRDVMYLMGLLPDEAVENGFAGASLGLEFAGIITRTGAAVRDLAVGQEVMGFAPACFASHVVTKAIAIAPKPGNWSFDTAATVPTVFFTVYYALKQLADLQPGERVLIHGGAGGIGIAAIQLARHLGAEVFATAGSDEKRDFVRLLGADHVFDSRSLAFAEEILAITQGEGVDVILNSLAGEAIRRNLNILRPFGRFLELGKRDFFENTPVGLRPFKNNISYFGIDADQLLISRPKLAGRLFADVMRLFAEGILSPLPFKAFDARHVVEAFRYMQQARQIGKVVVRLDSAKVSIEPTANAAALKFRPDGTWLITGGLSGFGLETARWLVAQGARSLALVGRRGTETPGAAAVAEEFGRQNVAVHLFACDVTDAAQVQSLLTAMQSQCAPLTGILHAAMVLDDGLIQNMTPANVKKVMQPKLAGAWNLHRLTLGMPLDQFILFSSATTFFGNPGQANYVAANVAMESLVRLRRKRQLPATCIGWGPIGDAGYLTRNTAVKDSLAAFLGAPPLSAPSALAMLGHLPHQQQAVMATVNFNWHTLSKVLASSQTPRFEFLSRLPGADTTEAAHYKDLRTMAQGLDAEETLALVQKLVRQEVAQILCIDAERINSQQLLSEQGMDSLMGVELALGLEKRFGVQLPSFILSEGPTVAKVSTRVIEIVFGNPDSSDADSPNNTADAIERIAAQHGEDIHSAEVAEAIEDMHHTAGTVSQ